MLSAARACMDKARKDFAPWPGQPPFASPAPRVGGHVDVWRASGRLRRIDCHGVPSWVHITDAEGEPESSDQSLGVGDGLRWRPPMARRCAGQSVRSWEPAETPDVRRSQRHRCRSYCCHAERKATLLDGAAALARAYCRKLGDLSRGVALRGPARRRSRLLAPATAHLPCHAAQSNGSFLSIWASAKSSTAYRGRAVMLPPSLRRGSAPTGRRPRPTTSATVRAKLREC